MQEIQLDYLSLPIISNSYYENSIGYTNLYNEFVPLYALKNSEGNWIVHSETKENIPYITYKKPSENLSISFSSSQKKFIDSLIVSMETLFDYCKCKVSNSNGEAYLFNFFGTILLYQKNSEGIYKVSFLGSFVVDSNYIFSKDFLTKKIKRKYFKFMIDVKVFNNKVLTSITKRFKEIFLEDLLSKGIEVSYVNNLENRIYKENTLVPDFKNINEKVEYEKSLIKLFV